MVYTFDLKVYGRAMSSLSIRDPRVRELARELASRRGANMTQAIIGALEEALAVDKSKVPLPDRLAHIADALAAKGEPGGRDLTKDERDALWGT
jgi:antitoxin VapB